MRTDKEFKPYRIILVTMNHIKTPLFYPAYSDTSTLYYPSGEVFKDLLICAMQKEFILWNFII